MANSFETLKAFTDLSEQIAQNDAVKKAPETRALQEAIKTGDRAKTLGALRLLESAVRREGLAQQFAGTIDAAKMTVGSALDNLATRVENVVEMAADTAGGTLKGAVESVPYGKETVEFFGPTANVATSMGKDLYDKTPTMLRLPILGTVIKGGAKLTSWIVHGFGSIVGFVNARGGKKIHSLADGIDTWIGDTALYAGLGLGIATAGQEIYKTGVVDGMLPESMKSTTGPIVPTITPPTKAIPPSPPTAPPAPSEPYEEEETRPTA